MNHCDLCKKRIWFWQNSWLGEIEKNETYNEIHDSCIMEILIADKMKRFKN